jgi:hypothetical protein
MRFRLVGPATINPYLSTRPVTRAVSLEAFGCEVASGYAVTKMNAIHSNCDSSDGINAKRNTLLCPTATREIPAVGH